MITPDLQACAQRRRLSASTSTVCAFRTSLGRLLAVTLMLTTLCAIPARAQRLSELKPGTLVRIATERDGRAVGPLAEVRGDSVYLSSTPSNPERAISLSAITAYEYSDGEGPGRPLRGALIGGVIGFGVGYLSARGDGKNSDDSMFIDGRSIFTLLGLIGTISGFAIGAADKPARWIRPSSPSVVLPVPGQRVPGTVFAIRIPFD